MKILTTQDAKPDVEYLMRSAFVKNYGPLTCRTCGTCVELESLSDIEWCESSEVRGWWLFGLGEWRPAILVYATCPGCNHLIEIDRAGYSFWRKNAGGYLG